MWSIKAGAEASLEDFQLVAGCVWSVGRGCGWVGRSWGEKCITEI